jgi:hypothetical protein
VGTDRWTAEIRVPTAVLGVSIREGDQWKVNVARGRKTGDVREHSTWFDGAFHQPSSFRTVVFGAEPFLRNGGFEETIALTTPLLLRQHDRSGWRHGSDPPRLPRFWGLHSGQVGLSEIVEGGQHSGRRAWRIKGGWVQQAIGRKLVRDATFRVRFHARGSGKLEVAMYLYEDTGDGPRTFRTTVRLAGVELADEWQSCEAVYRHEREDCARGALAFWADGSVVLDDVSVVPAPP